MKKLFEVDLGREHYSCMIDLPGRARIHNYAIYLTKEMQCEQDAVAWRTLLGSCRMHRNVDLGIHAAKQSFKLNP